MSKKFPKINVKFYSFFLKLKLIISLKLEIGVQQRVEERQRKNRENITQTSTFSPIH